MSKANLLTSWQPDEPDDRDFVYTAPNNILTNLPQKVDLSNQCPPIYNQGFLDSCTANALAGAFEFELKKQNAADFLPSRLFIYYNERVFENSIKLDQGARLRDGIKSLNTQGVCSEALWPYIMGYYAKKPDDAAYADALKHTISSFYRIKPDLNLMKSCLAEGYPFVFGFAAYSSFESPEVVKSGILNIPAANETKIYGHAVMAVGYDDSQGRFLIRNSHGALWGINGYFTMPYAYFTDEKLSSDFWTIRIVKS